MRAWALVFPTGLLAMAAIGAVVLFDPERSPGESASAQAVTPAERSEVAAPTSSQGPAKALRRPISAVPAQDRRPDETDSSSTTEPTVIPADERHRIKQRLFGQTLPDARTLAAHPAVNPQRIELSEERLDHLDVLLESLNTESHQLQQRESEVVEGCIEEKISRSQYVQIDGDSTPFQPPRGAVAFSRIEQGKPEIRVLLHPGEFPELDGVRDSRRELAHHSRQLVESYFDR